MSKWENETGYWCDKLLSIKDWDDLGSVIGSDANVKCWLVLSTTISQFHPHQKKRINYNLASWVRPCRLWILGLSFKSHLFAAAGFINA